MSCGVNRRLSLKLVLLCLWCRLAAAAPTLPIAWELPCAESAGPKKQKEGRNEGKKEERKE